MAEAGYPDFVMTFWTGVVAPAGTPQPVIERLNRAINDGLNSAEMKESLARFRVEPRPGTPQDFADFIASEVEEMGGRDFRGRHQGGVILRSARSEEAPASMNAVALSHPSTPGASTRSEHRGDLLRPMVWASWRTSCFWSSRMLMISGNAADFSRATSGLFGIDHLRLLLARTEPLAFCWSRSSTRSRAAPARPAASSAPGWRVRRSRALMLASCASLNSTAGFGCAGLAMRFGIAAGSRIRIDAGELETGGRRGGRTHRLGRRRGALRLGRIGHRHGRIHGRRIVVAARGARGLLLPIRGEARRRSPLPAPARRRRCRRGVCRGHHRHGDGGRIGRARFGRRHGNRPRQRPETDRTWSTATPVEASGERAALV